MPQDRHQRERRARPHPGHHPGLVVQGDGGGGHQQCGTARDGEGTAGEEPQEVRRRHHPPTRAAGGGR